MLFFFINYVYVAGCVHKSGNPPFFCFLDNKIGGLSFTLLNGKNGRYLFF
ncbi:hypothetical protein Ppha_2719 [Pelodictyon phaeoclathratiforme BU-1]|uniref:Uncharacterized protein n=1 Tax=Pelodictyon phaeoclathratiforme (strain DSM 5477 / BU-1) TaxID=324925 RepID=B4SGE1_PELPB|nr:hypothetical protein Ppha_2719 [Pelodictyon phaeoclathratiforme BU-1]